MNPVQEFVPVTFPVMSVQVALVPLTAGVIAVFQVASGLAVFEAGEDDKIMSTTVSPTPSIEPN
jgi:hypothetical protein